MKNSKKVIAIIAVLMWMMVIFIFSAMPSNESNSKSQGTINSVIEKTLEVTNDSGITDKHPTQEKMNKVVTFLNKPLRKVMHASVYLVLSILFYSCFYQFKISKWKNCILSIICSFLYACTDEFHQLFVDGRTSQFTDVLIDAMGAIFGIVFIIMIFKIKDFIISKKNKKLNLYNEKNSLSDCFIDIIANTTEKSIVEVANNVVVSQFPIASTISTIVKVSQSIYDKYKIKQTAKFIEGIRSQTISEENKNLYIEKLKENDDKTIKELERVLLILRKMESEEKSLVLGKFYVAFINKEIDEDKFFELSEALERVMITDLYLAYDLYKEVPKDGISVTIYDTYKPDRLISTGIVSLNPEAIKLRELTSNGRRDTFKKNGFGELFVKLAQR